MTSTRPRGGAAVAKAVELLLAAADDAGASAVSEIAARSDLPLSTAQRMLSVLTTYGLLRRVGRGRYAAGLSFAVLATKADLRSILIEAGRQPIRDLSRQLGVAVHLAVLDEDMVTYLVKEQISGPKVLTSELTQLEAYCSGLGKVLLSSLDPLGLDAYLDGGPLVALTPRTITDSGVLRREISKVRRQGFAVDNAEVQEGLYCLAVPVHGLDRQTIAALSASGTETIGRSRRNLAALRECSAKIRRRLYDVDAA